jgi:hypothetical protein
MPQYQLANNRNVTIIIGTMVGVAASVLQHSYKWGSVMTGYPSTDPSFVARVSEFWYMVNQLLARPVIALVAGVGFLICARYARDGNAAFGAAFVGGIILPNVVYRIVGL